MLVWMALNVDTSTNNSILNKTSRAQNANLLHSLAVELLSLVHISRLPLSSPLSTAGPRLYASV